MGNKCIAAYFTKRAPARRGFVLVTRKGNLFNQTGLMIFGWLWMPGLYRQPCSDFRHRSSCHDFKRRLFFQKARSSDTCFWTFTLNSSQCFCTALACPGPDSRQTFWNCSWGAQEKYRTSSKSCKWWLPHVHAIQLCKGKKLIHALFNPFRLSSFHLELVRKFVVSWSGQGTYGICFHSQISWMHTVLPHP